MPLVPPNKVHKSKTDHDRQKLKSLLREELVDVSSEDKRKTTVRYTDPIKAWYGTIYSEIKDDCYR